MIGRRKFKLKKNRKKFVSHKPTTRILFKIDFLRPTERLLHPPLIPLAPQSKQTKNHKFKETHSEEAHTIFAKLFRFSSCFVVFFCFALKSGGSHPPPFAVSPQKQKKKQQKWSTADKMCVETEAPTPRLSSSRCSALHTHTTASHSETDRRTRNMEISKNYISVCRFEWRKETTTKDIAHTIYTF